MSYYTTPTYCNVTKTIDYYSCYQCTRKNAKSILGQITTFHLNSKHNTVLAPNHLLAT